MLVCNRNLCWLVLAIVLASASGVACEETNDDLARQRFQMVETQIAARGVQDSRVLDALRLIPRHEFIHAKDRRWAYTDRPLAIEHRQTISQPYIVALMTELAEIDSTDRVLEIGTGSGYQAAVLSVLASQVFTIEILKPLADSARARLVRLGYDNVTVRTGDGFKGWNDTSSFDAIIVTCAPPTIPQPLIDQLADGGRLVIPVGEDIQELMLVVREGNTIKTMPTVRVRFVPMTGEAQTKE